MPHTKPPQPKETVRRLWNRHIKRFCDVWLCANNRSAKTVRAYRTDLTQFVRRLPRSEYPRRLCRASIEGWVAELQRQEYAASSIRRKLACLRGFFGYLVDQGELKSSPLRDVRLRLGAVKRLTRVVSRHDIRAVIHTVDRRASRYRTRGLASIDRLRCLRDAFAVRLLCVTGIRVGELVSLRLSSVHQQERTLVIHGKGARERLAFVTDHATALLLDRYLKERRQSFANLEELFTTTAGTKLSTDGMRFILRGLGKTAGVSSRITPHMLRHTAATALLENGADLRIVQEFLGHDSIRSTERYTHVARSHLLRVLRRANPLRRVA